MHATPLFDGSAEPVLTVTELTAQVRERARAGASLGARSSARSARFKRPASGHLYFNLKDGQAPCIRAVIWRCTASGCSFPLKDGLEVIARGQLSVYAPRGDYQL